MAESAVAELLPGYRFDAIGTSWRIAADVIDDPAVRREITECCATFDATWSRFHPDSMVTQYARSAGHQQFPTESAPMLAFYRSLYEVTDGAVTPLVGAALEHLGYGAGYRLRRRPGTPEIPDWDDVLSVDGAAITSTRPVLLDVGAAGKGFLVDLLSDVLQHNGSADHLIDGSGDLRQFGSESCRVALEHPLDPTTAIGVADLKGAALCASATNRRQWGDGLHHIVDPATGEPCTGVLATWVVADSAMLADGLSTALFLTDPAVLARQFRFSYVRMAVDGSVDWSTDFPGELFL